MLHIHIHIHAQVYVGTETHQTTGTGYHINGPLFPTMERTTLDFQSPPVANWNRELLHACGLVARAFYDIEVTWCDVLYMMGTCGRARACVYVYSLEFAPHHAYVSATPT